MTDFLLELRSEEIPARMQDKARDDLARLFTAELEKAGLKTDAIVTFATPRRLALIARDLPDVTEATEHETKGPRVGAPEQALNGFLQKYQLSRDQLNVRDGVYFAKRLAAGRPTTRVLQEAIEAIVRAFPWPKSMRWGEASASTESLRWVRPLHGIVALLGEDVVPCAIAGVQSGAATVGHRFHHPGVVTIGSAADYAEKLHACHVIVDQDERRAIIRERATALAAEAGLELIADEGLVAENAGLTEWPVPLLGRFDEEFLGVPPEVIQLTARVNQKYFVCRDAAGKLANAFVCTANIDAADGGVKIIEGNRKVLAARLSDARFFYETDLKVPLAEQAKKLEKIVFHQRLGSIANKARRVGSLAAKLAGHSSDDKVAEKMTLLARLTKADLVTAMVGEFPELQGTMGAYYAQAEGRPSSVVDAIRDHYLPGGQSGRCPNESLTMAINIADQIDTISCFFAIDEKPTGSRDPFGIRRSALSLLRLVIENTVRVPALRLINDSLLQIGIVAADEAENQIATRFNLEVAGAIDEIEFDAINRVIEFRGQIFPLPDEIYFPLALFNEIHEHRDRISQEIFEFLIDRLKVQQREAGVRHDLIDAVFALGGEDDIVRLLARVRALQSFVGTEDGANLLAGYKRAANILKKEGVTDAKTKTLSYTPEQAEADLIAALDAAEPAAADAVAGEDFEAAMAALATLRAPIDAFFDNVTVNDGDPAKRAARLALLARVRDAVHTVADFSKIEG